ncbi:hypothetical protein DKX38_008768 [Salix brachista]|uniref:Pectinesterase inhibitor domain-containing protein n=1 Tax=Salix brachista TaxID=2182728 RepID=A0A5N5M8X5_9ROSI|nr:hypothetical protein DKX38_008768 [Salix brachista]
MVRKDTVLVALTCLLVVASIAVCANATAAPRLLATEQVYYPQACLTNEVCVIRDSLKAVAAAFSSEQYQTSAVLEHAAVARNERIVASQHNRTMRSGCGSIYVLAYIAY